MERASLRRPNYLTNKPRISLLHSGGAGGATGEGVELKDLLRQFELHCNQIHYAAYRTAAKLQLVQKVLKFHQVKLSIVEHFLESRSPQLECTVEVDHLGPLLEELYACARREGALGDLPPTAATPAPLLRSLLLHLYHSSAGVDALSLKVALAVFASAKPIDKYKYLFQQFKDACNTLQRRELAAMLYLMAKIPELLGEKLTFGTQLVPAAVESCFKWNRWNQKTGGLSEEQFLGWMVQEPQTLVWISTHFRLTATQDVEHLVRCNICKVYPILGLRYRCLECFNFNLCQACFMTGATARSHKVKHQLQEYCQPASSWEEMKRSFHTLKRKLNLAHKHRQSYLSINPFFPQSTSDLAASDSEVTDEVDHEPATSPYSPKLVCEDNGVYWRELESIILRLEAENRQLQMEMERLHDVGSSGESQRSSQGSMELHRQEVLEDHSHQLGLQIQRLKQLRSLLTFPRLHQGYTSSTPNTHRTAPDCIIPPPAPNLSSIVVQPPTRVLSPQVPIEASSIEDPRQESLQFSTFRSSVRSPPPPTNTSLVYTAPSSLKFTFSGLADSSSLAMAPSPQSADNTRQAWNQVDNELQTIIDQLERILPQSNEVSSSSSFSRTQVMQNLEEAKHNVQGMTTHF